MELRVELLCLTVEVYVRLDNSVSFTGLLRRYINAVFLLL